MLGNSFEKDKVKIEYADFEFHQLYIQSEDEFEVYVLEKADIAVVLIEGLIDGKFGENQEKGYKTIIDRYNKNKKETDPGKKVHAPKLRPYVLIRENYKKDDLALLEKVREYGPYVEDFHNTAELKGLLIEHLQDDIKRVLSGAELIGSNQLEDESKGEVQIQESSSSEVDFDGTELNPPAQPGAGASSGGTGRKKPGRGKVLTITGTLIVLALLLWKLAPYYRPYVNSWWEGLFNTTTSTQFPTQSGDGPKVPEDTVKTQGPNKKPPVEPNKQDPLPQYIENGCTVISNDGDNSLVNALKGEILKCEALSIAFPEKGRTEWKIEIWEAKKQLDTTASGNYIAYFRYSASIHHKGNQVAGAESNWDNSYSRSRLGGDKALTEAREKARAEIINKIINKIIEELKR